MPTTYSSGTILVIDDNSLNLDLLCRILAKVKFETISTTSGEDAINLAHQKHPDLILLDIMMPNFNGFEVCRTLKKHPSTQNIPIIFMSGLVDTEKKVEAFRLGGSDYITKPFQKAELLARVKSQLQVCNLRQALADKNIVLQNEINHRYEGEILLLNMNERLSQSNKFLKKEIENHKATELKLQAEITERKQAEQKVNQSLREKNLLLKEIHHRVKNNLFIVSSLLESQADYIEDEQVIKILENSQNRITSMALIHEQLHSSTNLFQIDFQLYITALTEHIADSYLTDRINFQADIEQAELNIETAHPCGLIVNELISNALEHAFPNDKEGNIILKFYQDESGYCNLLLEDDGVGFPDHKNFYESESLGLELVSTLVEQLDGKIEMKSDRGTKIKITFKELDYKTRV